MSYKLPAYPYVPVDADLVPKALGYIMVVLAVLLYFDKQSETNEEKEKRAIPKKEIGVLSVVAFMIFCYIFLFELLGFVVVTALFLFICSRFLGYTNVKVNAIVSVLFPSLLYYLFHYLLQIRLPQGILPF